MQMAVVNRVNTHADFAVRHAAKRIACILHQIENNLGELVPGQPKHRKARFKLWFQRDANRPREELLPLPDGTFAYGEASRVSFVREGGLVVAMQMATPTGQLSTFPRSR